MRLQKLQAHLKRPFRRFPARSRVLVTQQRRLQTQVGTLPTFMPAHTCLAGHLQQCGAKSASTVLPGDGEGGGVCGILVSPLLTYLLTKKKKIDSLGNQTVGKS